MSDAPLTNPRDAAPLPPRPQRLGDVLREAREEKGLDISDVARITHVRKEYLKALDEGRYGDLPEEVYTRNFIKLYAQAVGLDDVRLLERYSRERELAESSVNDAPRPITPPSTRPRKQTRQPRAARGNGGAGIVTILLSLIFVGVLVGVAVWGYNELFFTSDSRLTRTTEENTAAVTGTQAEAETPGAETGETGAGADEAGAAQTDPIRAAAAGAASSQASTQDTSVTGAGAAPADTVFLTLTSVPPNAEVSIDNYDFPGTTPLTRAPMTPGENRVLRVNLEGFEPYEVPIDLSYDRNLSVVLTPLESATGGTLIEGAGAATDTVVDGAVVDTDAPTGGAVPGAEGTLTVTAEATSWLEVYGGAARGEGETLLYRNVEPGETLTFETPVYLFAGNAGGVLVAEGGGERAPLGGSGQVLGRAFGE